jgi:hypothetical protein
MPASSALGGLSGSPFGDVDLSIECITIKQQLNREGDQAALNDGAQRSRTYETDERSLSSSGRVGAGDEREASIGGASSTEANRRMSTPTLGNLNSTYAIKPQSRLSFSGRDRGASVPLGPTMSIDLAGAATLADPVREMFPSVETIPNTIRKGPDRNSLNLSFLGDLSDVNDDDESSFQSHVATTPVDTNNNCSGDGGGDDDDEGDTLGGLSSSFNSLLDLSAALPAPPDPDLSATPPLPSVASADEFAESSAAESQELEGGTSDNGSGSAQLDEPLFAMDEAMDTSGFYDMIPQHSVVSADDFLPMFTFVVVQAALPQLLIVKELMTALVDDEETYGETGYYLATLEASTQHIVDLAQDWDRGREWGGGLPGNSRDLSDAVME